MVHFASHIIIQVKEERTVHGSDFDVHLRDLLEGKREQGSHEGR